MPVNYDRSDGGYKLPAITDPDRICIQLEIPNDPDHKAAFWGALWTLTWYNAWQKDDAKRGKDVAAVWKDVWFKARAANVDWDACINCDEDGCVEYSPQFIQEWYPNNPYISVPDGLVKKWYIAPPINLIGVPAGVVVTDILNTAPGGSGDFIRCRFTFSGTGTVEIHWHTVHFGGLAQVQVDSDITKIYYVELGSDPTAAPPEPTTALQTEYEFTVPGEHHIDITMLPQIKTDIEAVGYGGGIVKIVLCGFDNMVITPQFRFTPACGMEYSVNSGATWQPVDGWDTYAPDCFTGPAGADGQDGADGATGPQGPAGADGQDCDCDEWQDPGNVPNPPGESGDDKRCMVANRVVNALLDRLYLPWLTDAAVAFYEQGLTDAQIAQQFNDYIWSGYQGDFETTGLEGIVQWHSWLAVVSSPLILVPGVAGLTGNITALFEAYAALDILEVRDEINSAMARNALMCALYNNLNQDGDIDAATYVLWKSAITGLTTISADAKADFVRFLDQLVPLSSVRLAALDTVADTSFDCILCTLEEPEEPTHDWSATFDFSISDYDFFTTERGSTVPAQSAEWVSGVGWRSTYNRSGGLEEIVLIISRTSVSGTIVAARWLWSYEPAGGTNQAHLSIAAGGLDNLAFPTDAHGMRYDQESYSPSRVGDSLQCNVTVGTEGTSGTDWDGSEGEAIIRQLRIFGTGTRPAGLSGVPD